MKIKPPALTSSTYYSHMPEEAFTGQIYMETVEINVNEEAPAYIRIKFNEETWRPRQGYVDYLKWVITQIEALPPAKKTN